MISTETSTELTLELNPQHRFDVIDVTKRLRDEYDNPLERYSRVLYCSHHTTAGYFDQSLCMRLDNNPESLQDYLASFKKLFPEGADYKHDQIELRSELSDEEKACEPMNADSHLTFISAGLENCVTYRHRPDTPVYFIDLDGVCDGTPRLRRTTVLGFNREAVAGSARLAVPVSRHPIDAVSFRDSRAGVMDELNDYVRRFGIQRGRVDLSLAPDEHDAGLTVNEYETLLMKYDVAEVLRNPFRFMAQKGKHMLLDPAAIPDKARNYAKYDLVLVMNKVLDKLRLNDSVLERALDKFMAVPASRYLRMKRSVSLLISDRDGAPSIVQGRYQSPILIQWMRAKAETRRLDATFIRFD